MSFMAYKCLGFKDYFGTKWAYFYVFLAVNPIDKMIIVLLIKRGKILQLFVLRNETKQEQIHPNWKTMIIRWIYDILQQIND